MSGQTERNGTGDIFDTGLFNIFVVIILSFFGYGLVIFYVDLASMICVFNGGWFNSDCCILKDIYSCRVSSCVE